jgi:hypothetical protein
MDPPPWENLLTEENMTEKGRNRKEKGQKGIVRSKYCGIEGGG